MGDFVNAIRDYQAAVKTDPSYALAYYNAANVYFRQRQFKQVSGVWAFTINRLSPWSGKRTVKSRHLVACQRFCAPLFTRIC